MMAIHFLLLSLYRCPSGGLYFSVFLAISLYCRRIDIEMDVK